MKRQLLNTTCANTDGSSLDCWYSPQLGNNLMVPKILVNHPVRSVLITTALMIAATYPKTLWLVSSTTHALTGAERTTEPGPNFGPSHLDGMALDIAPVSSRDSVFNPDRSDPRLGDSILLAYELTKLLPFPAAIVAEGNHLHLDAKLDPSNLYMLPTFHSGYSNDKRQNLDGRYIALVTFKEGDTHSGLFQPPSSLLSFTIGPNPADEPVSLWDYLTYIDI